MLLSIIVRVLRLGCQFASPILAWLTPPRLSNSVGRTKFQRVMMGGVDQELYIGRRAQELRGLLRIKYPVAHGIVEDWEDMERIWKHVYDQELGTLPEEVGPRG